MAARYVYENRINFAVVLVIFAVIIIVTPNNGVACSLLSFKQMLVELMWFVSVLSVEVSTLVNDSYSSLFCSIRWNYWLVVVTVHKCSLLCS